MAKCPNPKCDIVWQWGFCTDLLRKKGTGEFCEDIEVFKDKTVASAKAEAEVRMFVCDCGLILGFSAIDPIYGGPVFTHPEWNEVVWDSGEHSYPKD